MSATRHLYHVTTADRLRRIAENGLRPNERRSIGGASLDHHSSGRVFLTSAAGVPFWLERADAFIVHRFDDYDKKGIAPVVLRAEISPDEMSADPVGTRDARADAYWTDRTIPPEKLSVWNGKAWAPPGERLDLSPAFDEEGYLASDSPFLSPNFDEPQIQPGEAQAMLAPVRGRNLPVLPNPDAPRLHRKDPLGKIRDQRALELDVLWGTLVKHTQTGGSLDELPPALKHCTQQDPAGTSVLALSRLVSEHPERSQDAWKDFRDREVHAHVQRDDIHFTEASEWLDIQAEITRATIAKASPGELHEAINHQRLSQSNTQAANGNTNPHMDRAVLELRHYVEALAAKKVYDFLADLPFPVGLGITEAGTVRVLADSPISIGDFNIKAGEPLHDSRVDPVGKVASIGPEHPEWGGLPDRRDVSAASEISQLMRAAPALVPTL